MHRAESRQTNRPPAGPQNSRPAGAVLDHTKGDKLNCYPGNTTNYLAVVGKGLAFEPDNRPLKIQEFTDGTSNTLLAVQANDDKAVPWTKPDDLEVDMKKPLEGLGEAEPNGFSVVFADGSVRLLSKNINAETLRRLFGRADGQVVDPNELNPWG